MIRSGVESRPGVGHDRRAGSEKDRPGASCAGKGPGVRPAEGDSGTARWGSLRSAGSGLCASNSTKPESVPPPQKKCLVAQQAAAFRRRTVGDGVAPCRPLETAVPCRVRGPMISLSTHRFSVEPPNSLLHHHSLGLPPRRRPTREMIIAGGACMVTRQPLSVLLSLRCVQTQRGHIVASWGRFAVHLTANHTARAQRCRPPLPP